MGSFARSRARNNRKKAGTIDKKARQEAARARRSVKEAYVCEWYRGKATRSQALHNLSACFLLAMNEAFGFGAGRLMQLHDRMQEEFECIVDGYVTIEEISDYLGSDEIGLSIGIAAKDPKANHYRQIEFRAVKEMSSAFLMALLNEFGFKAKRLAKAYGQVCDLSDRVLKKETTYDEIHRRLKAIMEKKAKYPREGHFEAITHTRTRESA